MAVQAALAMAEDIMDLNMTLLESPNYRIILPDSGIVWFKLIAQEFGGGMGAACLGAGPFLPVSSEYGIVWWDPHTCERTERGGNDTNEHQRPNEAMEPRPGQTSLAYTDVWATLRGSEDSEGWIQNAHGTTHMEAYLYGREVLMRIPGLGRKEALMKEWRRITGGKKSFHGAGIRPTSSAWLKGEYMGSSARGGGDEQESQRRKGTRRNRCDRVSEE